uniref:Zf-TFIIIC domain-containing protein n=4 Tax=Mesocestoides corti TaxID=53468 RepID=A0A5K3FFX7_MESCO
MVGHHEQFRVTLPARKVPVGKIAVSGDNEFLVIFKDSIGLFIPNLGLTSDDEEDVSNYVGSRMQFFTPPGDFLQNYPFTFVGDAAHSSREVARYAITRCERVALIASTRTTDTRDYLCHTFRNADWSPPGVDKISRTVFSCVTGSHQLLICLRNLEAWTCVANLSNHWFDFWRSQGLQLLAECRYEFLEVPDGGGNEDKVLRSSEAVTRPLECRTVRDFFSSLAESSFMLSTWSLRVRESKSQTIRCNCLLVALHKSGGISFWDVTIPLVDERSIRLCAVDRTYAVPFDPPHHLARPNFIKVIDIDCENIILVVGFTNSRVVCVTYHAYAKIVNKLSVKRICDVDLCVCSSGLIAVGDAAFADNVLAIAHGTRLIVASVLNQKNIQIVANFTSDMILKPISGVRIFRNHLFISSLDGIIAQSPVPSQVNKNPDFTVLTKASTLGGRNFHRFFSGLHLTPNGVYAAFLESTLAPALCTITSNLVFLSVLPKTAVIAMMESLGAPMRTNFDCLHEVALLLRSPKLLKPLHTERPVVNLDAEAWFQKLLAYQNNVILNNTQDPSKLELHKLQFRRAIAILLGTASVNSEDVKQRLQAQVKRLDQILALRQIDRCYRLFLRTEVQRQCQDCVLVFRIAILCQRVLESPATVGDVEAPALCARLSRASEVVKNVAQKLYTKRFAQSSDIDGSTLLHCPICQHGLTPDLFSSICPRGHKFVRCASTFAPCMDTCFNECPSCRRCSVFLPPESRPSQWRREVNSRFCPFCNSRFSVVLL